ncbi:Serine/arginine-rich splicing factor 7 [Nymphon striatum]|nr:Serine/arginine-rich splicing factor 7 [Nymphon striatum]
MSEEDDSRLHIADLGTGIDCSKREIERVFEKYGKLREVWLARNPPCFAFVVYDSKDDADEALRHLDGTMLCGGRIRVTIARPRTRGRGRNGWDPNMRCYQCGEKGHFSRDCVDTKYGYRRPPTRSASKGKGKIKALKCMLSSDESFQVFDDLGSEWELSDELFHGLDKCVYLLYSQPTCTNVNMDRYNLFKMRYSYESSLLSNSDSLRHHSTRACYQDAIHQCSLNQIMSAPNSINYGWQQEKGELSYVWMKQPPAPPNVMKTVIVDVSKLGIRINSAHVKEEIYPAEGDLILCLFDVADLDPEVVGVQHVDDPDPDHETVLDTQDLQDDDHPEKGEPSVSPDQEIQIHFKEIIIDFNFRSRSRDTKRRRSRSRDRSSSDKKRSSRNERSRSKSKERSESREKSRSASKERSPNGVDREQSRSRSRSPEKSPTGESPRNSEPKSRSASRNASPVPEGMEEMVDLDTAERSPSRERSRSRSQS